jgi:putative ABC transport system permease protein
MLRVALKSALFNKRRLVGTGLSIVIGIAFLAGTFVFTDTIDRTFSNLFSDVYNNTDAYVRSSSELDMPFGQKVYARIPDSIVDQVKGVEGVATVVPDVSGYARIIGSDGKPIGFENGAPHFGSSAIDSPLVPWRLQGASKYPIGPDQVMIDAASAKEGKFSLGDRVTVASQGGTRDFTLVGIVRFGNADSAANASFALFDLATAQSFVGQPGEVDAILVGAKPGVTEQELASRLQSRLGVNTNVLTGAQIIEETQSSLRKSMSYFRILLLVFAAVALFVGSFIIYNTFSIIVAQKQTENALLRAVGASRWQIISSMLVESIIIGTIASALGFFGGIAMSSVLKGFMAALGIDIPGGGLVLLPRTVLASFVVGIFMTVLAAVAPSVRASNVAPVAAMRDVAIDRSASSKWRLLSGLVVSAVGALMVIYGLVGGTVEALGGGIPVLFIGIFVLGPLMARPIAGVIGSPLPSVVGITGTLARRNSMRNPKRTARTAAALMVGVALVTGISILAASIKSSIRSVIGDQFSGDLVVNTQTQGIGGLPPDLTAKLNELPEIGTATGLQISFGKINDSKTATFLSVVDPATVGDVFDLKFVEGNVADLTANGIAVSKSRAKRNGMALGDIVTLTLIDGVARPLTVQAIYSEDELAGPYTVSKSLVQQSGADNYDFAVYASLAPGVSEAAALKALAPLMVQYPTGKLLTRSQYISTQAKQIDQFVNLIYGLLALAIIIAIFGIANTMSLSVYERTRELGLLRAVGAYRAQVRASVRWESVITALLGTAQGIILGLLLGYAIIVSLRNKGLSEFTLPVPTLLIVVALAIIAGVVASIRPARRAARLDILRALSRH